MKKATYKGHISQDVQSFDLANINVYDWFSQFPKNLASAKEKGLVEKLTSVIKSNDVENNYTFSDDRFVLIATNLIRLVPKDKYNFTISEYLIFYRYLQVKYDESIQGINSLIEFVNQMIGFSAEDSRERLSDEQYQILSETAESIELQALRMCPLFIAEDIENAIKKDVEEVDMAGVEVLEKPEEEDDDFISEIEAEEELEEIEEILRMTDAEELVGEPVDEEAEGEPAEVAEWRDTINTLQELIDENSSPELNEEWQDTIDTLKELIADSGYTYGDGGEVDEIKSEIERQEKKLGLAALPESAKDAIRKKISELKGRLEKQEEKPKAEPKEEAKEEKSSMSDADIRAEIEKQEKKLGLAALPESAKEAIRKKIAQLKGQLGEEQKPAETKKKKIISTRKEKKEPIVKKPISKPKEKVIDRLEEIEEEEEEVSPIEKIRGKKEVEEQEVKVPKKRGRKPKAKVEPAEPKVPKKRGRKPKPKDETAEPKVPQKRGRKPKAKLSLSDFGLSKKFNINDYI